MEFQCDCAICHKEMDILHSHTTVVLSDWLLAIGVLLGTGFFATTVRALLKRVDRDRNWPILNELATSISNILYIVGLKIFADVAPLHGKIEVWIDGAIYVFGVIVLLRLVQRAALVAVSWSSIKTNSSETLHQGFIPLLKNIFTLFIFFSGGIMVLKHFNYDVMSLVAALGVGSLAVGLAAKDTLSNMMSGFILIIDRNLSPGDRINLSGAVGDVEEIGLRSTRLRMPEGNTLIVPNSDLVNTKILNLSIPTREQSTTVSIRVPYTVEFSTVKSLALGVLDQMQTISKNRSMSVYLADLSKGYQLVQIWFWVKEMTESSAVISEFNVALIEKFQKEQIPFVPPLQLSSQTQ
jgi:MscS family membrane protein